MTSWFRLTLICWRMLCLLLGLTQPADLNHQLPIVGSGSWFDRGTRSRIRRAHRFGCQKHGIHLARAGPRQSLVLELYD